MNTNKIKKLIAREGLIILGCVALEAALFSLGSFMPERDLPYRHLVTTGGHKYHIDGDGIMESLTDEDKSALFKGLVNKHPEDFDEKSLLKLPADAFPLDLKIQYERKLIDWKNIFFTLGFWGLFIYPFYLIICFILWSIKTLKKSPVN